MTMKIIMMMNIITSTVNNIKNLKKYKHSGIDGYSNFNLIISTLEKL